MKNALRVPPRHLTDSLPFSSSFELRPAPFYTRLMPTPRPEPYLVGASASAAGLIDLDPAEFATPHFFETFTGNRIPTGAVPLAAVYSGHQFGVWADQPGDGRAILPGEVPAPSTPYPGTLELQLKGPGRTPYSRMGDGRAVLRSSIREFLCSEAMLSIDFPTGVAERALSPSDSKNPTFPKGPPHVSPSWFYAH